jgi:hypothetical protein
MTPLGISSAQNAGDSASRSIVFNRLALLPAPRFTVRTPETKAETEVHLKKHTESMTRLQIGDLDREGSEALFSRPSRTVDSNSAKAKAHTRKGSPRVWDASWEIVCLVWRIRAKERTMRWLRLLVLEGM